MGRGKRERRKAAKAPRIAEGAPASPSDRLTEPALGPRLRSRALLGVAAAVVIVAIAAGAWWWQSAGRSQALLAGASPPARAARDLRRPAGVRAVPPAGGAALAGIASRPRDAAGDRGQRRRELRQCPVHLRRRHLDLLRRDGKFVVRTDGPDGTLRDYDVKYTFGTAPLQQYLIELAGGRLQALGIAWDTRPRAEGGQRWFHLYPGQNVTHRDELHWTANSQNWNFMCAECHSTGVRKNYDPTTRRYSTTYAAVNVACEGCHGPGSSHVAWAKKSGDGQRLDDRTKGLVVALDERKGVTWTISAETATRSGPRPAGRRAKSRRAAAATRGAASSPITTRTGGRSATRTGRAAGGPSLLPRRADPRRGVRVRLVSPEQDVPRGVTCSDCHDPHSGKLRAPGSQVCLGCHAAEKYQVAKHHFHPTGSRGADCVGCHMPTTTYMVVDPRHDHSFRVPRPDLSVKLGVPNACTRCHADRSSVWAAKQVETWYGRPPRAISATPRRCNTAAMADRARRICCKPSPVTATSRHRARERARASRSCARPRRLSRLSARG